MSERNAKKKLHQIVTVDMCAVYAMDEHSESNKQHIASQAILILGKKIHLVFFCSWSEHLLIIFITCGAFARPILIFFYFVFFNFIFYTDEKLTGQ